ncbi:MAG: YebC/PmpR family DNA-binding transcriptional regulator [Candidatus Sumerlaeia bacterium]|nr:YebC/PmpR family DNA-binding transcriptional regulator [Candidatus Sumerlaeia bacterium]
MSGHSKWHSIKHKKALIDAKRGKMFTKVIKEIQIAARLGGSDPSANPRLRTAIQAAKDSNMPKDTMERAIKKGAGELGGDSYEDLSYEGYGPGGVAVMIKLTTDNRNRTAGEIRHIFSKNGGNMGTDGCVSYLFARVGEIVIENAEEEKLLEAALEAGADDVESDEGTFIVKTPPETVQDIREKLEAQGFRATNSAARYIPANYVRLEGKDATQCAKLLAMLDDNDDVTEVAHNLEATDEVMEAMS